MSILRVFVVHDVKVGAYLQPFFCRTVGEAMRSWEAICNDGKSMMSVHATDFTLFETGEYNEQSGRFTQHDVLRPISTALEAKKDSPWLPPPQTATDVKSLRASLSESATKQSQSM